MLDVFADKPKVSLVAEPIFHWGPLAITNSMMLGALGYLAVIALFVGVAIAVKCGARGRFVYFFMWIFEMLLSTMEQVMGNREKARRLAPLAITLFFFIIINYWMGVLPFVGPVKIGDVPLFRGLVADLNTTFALAIITMVTVQIYAIRGLGPIGNLRRYFINPFKDPAHAFEGFLEFIAEFSRGTALSLRLFGNVFAGEVLIAMVGFLTNWVAPIALPLFMALELFVGAIQSYVFFMLTIVFIGLGDAAAHAHADHSSDEKDNVGGGDSSPVPDQKGFASPAKRSQPDVADAVSVSGRAQVMRRNPLPPEND